MSRHVAVGPVNGQHLGAIAWPTSASATPNLSTTTSQRAYCFISRLLLHVTWCAAALLWFRPVNKVTRHNMVVFLLRRAD